MVALGHRTKEVAQFIVRNMVSRGGRSIGRRIDAANLPQGR